ncbi:MAG: EF-P lysine aminoacylase EpmA, partial [Bdellovibrionales bacterium]
PLPPFQLGGWFFREGGRCFIGDARARFELTGLPALFTELRDGDQTTVSVVAVTKKSIECDKASRTVRAEISPGVPRGQHAEEFARFVRMIRDFFVQQGLQEIETPTLVTCPGLEPYLEPFSVEIKRGRESQVAYLPTSPEIHLKKALAQGWTDIFEIKSCFRKGEFSPHHENEFHMLEWYRGFADLERITLDLRELLKECVRTGFTHGVSEPQVITFKKLFHELLAFDLHPATTREELRLLCDRLGIHALEDDSFNDLFHRLLIDKIEPKFKAMGPLIVRDFPPSQAALARLTSEGWADRFEFYWQGLEIANAFNEVTDAEEQLVRWRLEQDERLHLGTSEVPQDPGLIEALRRGIPPTGGIALGVERLFMACRGIDEIRDLKLFTSDDLFAGN